MLQIGVMPLLNGRSVGGELGGGEVRGLTQDDQLSYLPSPEQTWRGVQIPLPEGINFVNEVVTNHAVSGAWGERHLPLPFPLIFSVLGPCPMFRDRTWIGYM